jgi:hypothetical protein
LIIFRSSAPEARAALKAAGRVPAPVAAAGAAALAGALGFAAVLGFAAAFGLGAALGFAAGFVVADAAGAAAFGAAGFGATGCGADTLLLAGSGKLRHSVSIKNNPTPTATITAANTACIKLQSPRTATSTPANAPTNAANPHDTAAQVKPPEFSLIYFPPSDRRFLITDFDMRLSRLNAPQLTLSFHI